MVEGGISSDPGTGLAPMKGQCSSAYRPAFKSPSQPCNLLGAEINLISET